MGLGSRRPNCPGCSSASTRWTVPPPGAAPDQALVAPSARPAPPPPEQPPRPLPPTPAPAGGWVTAGGPPADLRLVTALKHPFHAANPQVTVQATASPIGGELSAVLGGSVSASLADYPKAAALAPGDANKLVDHLVGVNRVLIIAHPNQTVGALSLHAGGNLFAGKYTNWHQLGGLGMAIH